MLKQTSRGFRKQFLLLFTRELINAAGPDEILKLDKILEKESKEGTIIQKESRKLVKDILKEKEKELKFLEQEEKKTPLEKLRKPNLKKSLDVLKKPRPVLRIPETKLPSTFDYLRPTSTKTEIDLGKLNSFIQDPLVKIIECNGPEENIAVNGAMGLKPTKIVLSKQEIDEVIKKFAEAAKIPQDEGVFKAVVGNLTLSGIISEVVGSKFVIRKMMYNPGFSY